MNKYINYNRFDLFIFSERTYSTMKYRTNILLAGNDMIHSQCFPSQENKLYFNIPKTSDFYGDQLCNIYQFIFSIEMRYWKYCIFVNTTKYIIYNDGFPYS